MSNELLKISEQLGRLDERTNHLTDDTEEIKKTLKRHDGEFEVIKADLDVLKTKRLLNFDLTRKDMFAIISLIAAIVGIIARFI